MPFPAQIIVDLQPKQEILYNLFENSPATWLGFGGSRGGAKSHGARAAMLLRRLRYPGTAGVIIRRTWQDLWDEHVTLYFRDWPFLREFYNAQHKEITLPNQSVIRFRYFEHHGDVEKQLQGKGFMDIIVDEATKHTEKDLTFLRTCCRWPGMPDNACKLLLTMNPGGISHDFVKRIFISGPLDHTLYREKERPQDYKFIQSRLWDNVEWVRSALRDDKMTVADYYAMPEDLRFKYCIERSDYGKRMDSLPHALRIGHLMGDWDQFAGQYFDIFERSRFVKDLRGEIREWYPKWLSIDWGFAHNCAVYEHVTLPDTSVHTRKELVTYGKTPADLAKLVFDQFGQDRISDIFISPDMNRRTQGPRTIAQQFSDELDKYGMCHTTLANPARVAGWMLWYQLMQADMWSVDPSCKILIDTIPNATRGEDDKSEDIVKVNVDGASGSYGDDSWESVRMGLLSKLGPAQAPLEQRVWDKVKHLNMTSRQHAMAKVIKMEAAKSTMLPWTMKRPQRHAI